MGIALAGFNLLFLMAFIQQEQKRLKNVKERKALLPEEV